MNPVSLLLGGGSFLGNLLKGNQAARKQNTQSRYEQQQQEKDYLAQQALSREKDQRGLDSIDFLQGVARAKGYNIPDSAFEALKRRGAYSGPSVADRFAVRPKESTLWGPLLSGGIDVLNNMASSSGMSDSPQARAQMQRMGGISTPSPSSDPAFYDNLFALAGKGQ